jgi:hypothetical protein
MSNKRCNLWISWTSRIKNKIYLSAGRNKIGSRMPKMLWPGTDMLFSFPLKSNDARLDKAKKIQISVNKFSFGNSSLSLSFMISFDIFWFGIINHHLLLSLELLALKGWIRYENLSSSRYSFWLFNFILRIIS